MLHCHSVMWQGRVSTRMSVVSVCAQTPMDLCAHRHTYMSTGIHICVPTWTTKTSTWINIYTPCSHTNNSACILTHVHVYSHTCACSTYTYACACSQIHTHLPMCTSIHTLCISFPLFKSQAPYEHLRCPCLFSSVPQSQTFSIHHPFLYISCCNASTYQEYFLCKKCMFWWIVIAHLYSSVWAGSHRFLLLLSLGVSGVLGKGMMQFCMRISLCVCVPCLCDPEGPASHQSTKVLHTLLWPFSHWGISSSSFISRANL